MNKEDMVCDRCGSDNLRFYADNSGEDDDGEWVTYDVKCLECGNFSMGFSEYISNNEDNE